MLPEIYKVLDDGNGFLAVMARPRSGEWLRDELRGLGELGVATLASLLKRREEVEMGLSLEASVSKELGLRFVSFPIADRGVPARVQEFQRFAAGLAEEIRGGRGVAVHCRAGIGRSGITAAAVLVCLGHHPREAFSLVSKARGVDVPDTQEQVEWFRENFASRATRQQGAPRQMAQRCPGCFSVVSCLFWLSVPAHRYACRPVWFREKESNMVSLVAVLARVMRRLALGLVLVGLPITSPVAFAAEHVRAVELTFLQSTPGNREKLKQYIVQNWFAMDRIAKAEGLMEAFTVLDTGTDEGPWNVVVSVTYPDAKGYEGIKAQFERIRAAHHTELVDGKTLAELGAVVESRKLYENPAHASR